MTAKIRSKVHNVFMLVLVPLGECILAQVWCNWGVDSESVWCSRSVGIVAVGVLGLDRGISAHFCRTDLAQSYYPSATTMAPLTKYLCPCFKCNSRKKLIKRTIMAHFKENQDHLAHLRASGAHQDTVDFVQNCHDENYTVA
jgi:hypothetical protein